ncbi:copper chaperone PCu(A)C [Bradyrhizobium sp. USDA 3315]
MPWKPTMLMASARALLSPIAGVAVLAFFNSTAVSHELEVGTLLIQHPWVAAKDTTNTTTTAYVIEIQNSGTRPDRLLGASLSGEKGILQEADAGVRPAKFATHEHGFQIEPGGFVRLQPGGARILFEGLHGALKEGEMVKGTLEFEKAGTIEIEFTIEPAGMAEEDNTPIHHHTHR